MYDQALEELVDVYTFTCDLEHYWSAAGNKDCDVMTFRLASMFDAGRAVKGMHFCMVIV